ncbi:Uncharacterised protein [Vibrio cholerae]|uniref:Uncharacterized protein n=1 Tax=Vibrio cholerae TaxID=666 RepID=A0A655VB60_VIBCL|nr:Uncharacterised protein [Vibrio cholerae]CSB65725.1 Uncharacterised protein [Vibrio cholerae]CSB98605.1 Uncharacterised protein [Vibrio cholerae]CSC44241.1 Uncharacterised protein [Vibrio cholerae]CSC85950.1 Uncharacterised protein [Vibrio cholerae]
MLIGHRNPARFHARHSTGHHIDHGINLFLFKIGSRAYRQEHRR